MRKCFFRFFLLCGTAAILSGCTVYPPGERAERDAALAAGRPFVPSPGQRPAPPLPAHPTPDDLVRYALLRNADIERQYWQWRAAIEQIPQAGTQATNFALSAGTTISLGGVSSDRTTLTAMNDPMADIVWPEKLSVAARRALQEAHAAGLRFQQAKFDLRSRVLDAYCDYALAGEMIRLEQANAQLLQTAVADVDARYRSGAAGQQELLKAQSDLDLSRSDLASLQSQIPARRAALNALLNRDTGAMVPMPGELPPIHPIPFPDDRLLALAARRNPELAALAAQVQGNRDAIRLARLQYLPDFSISAGTDLAGLTQTLAGMVTVPLLRYQSIDAAIAQAQADLRAAEAMRIQTQNDLNARIILDLTTVHDADRQLQLLDRTLIPRTRQAETIGRTEYETSQSTLLDLLDTQRSLIALRRLEANLHVEREKRRADLEAITAKCFDEG